MLLWSSMLGSIVVPLPKGSWLADRRHQRKMLNLVFWKVVFFSQCHMSF